MSLRVKLFAAFAAVVLLGVGASLVAAERYLATLARETVEAELWQASTTYEALDVERTARRGAEARVVAEEPRLKAVSRTEDIDQATLEDVADEMRTAAGAEVFALTDRTGKVVADVSLHKLP